VRLTDRDLQLLAFAADHRVVLTAHLQRLLDVSAATARGRLRSLAAEGYLMRRKPFQSEPPCYQLTRAGLAAIGGPYTRARFDLGEYRHDVGVAWLWLAARQGAWGAMSEVVSERRMRSADASREPGSRPMGVRLGGFGQHGKERLHYPDLLLVTPQGHRVALELELTAKSRTRLEAVIGGYAADPRIDAVVYLVDADKGNSIARAVKAAAHRCGVEHLVHVQGVRYDRSSGAAAMDAGRERARAGVRRAGAAPRAVRAGRARETDR
jgi:hypothetical protein